MVNANVDLLNIIIQVIASVPLIRRINKCVADDSTKDTNLDIDTTDKIAA